MREWLIDRVLAAEAAGREAGLDWRHSLNCGASKSQIEQAEARLQTSFPNELRDLLRATNGGIVLGRPGADPDIAFLSTDEIVAEAEGCRADWGDSRTVHTMIFFARLPQDTCYPIGVAPTSDRANPWPVFEAYEGVEPDRWMSEWCVAGSVKQFVSRLFEEIIEQHRRPGYWIGHESLASYARQRR